MFLSFNHVLSAIVLFMSISEITREPFAAMKPPMDASRSDIHQVCLASVIVLLYNNLVLSHLHGQEEGDAEPRFTSLRIAFTTSLPIS